MSVERRSRACAWASAAGLAVGAVGVLIQALTGGNLPRPVPPGVVILAVAAAVTVGLRRWWVFVCSGFVAVFALLNVVDVHGPDALLGGAGMGVAVGKWMLLAGAATALVADALALSRVRRARARDTATTMDAPVTRESVWPRRAQVAGLLILAPVCAEYLAAYDDTTGAPLQLLAGLLIFVPLYGAPALVIREVSRRAGLGWPGMIFLSAAFGLTQAGVVDQSLFSLDYRHIASWDEGLRGTFVVPLGLSAYNLLNFVGGHVIYSICAPIALVEAFRPCVHREAWLSKRALAVTAVVYVAVSALILHDSLTSQTTHASTQQILGSVAGIALLIAGAAVLGRRGRVGSGRPATTLRTVFLIALGIALAYQLAPATWPGFALAVSALTVGGVLTDRTSRSPGWTVQHVVAIAAAAVLTRAVLAFTYFPVIGDVSAMRKYSHNAVLLAGIAAICLLAWRASQDRFARAHPE